MKLDFNLISRNSHIASLLPPATCWNWVLQEDDKRPASLLVVSPSFCHPRAVFPERLPTLKRGFVNLSIVALYIL